MSSGSIVGCHEILCGSGLLHWELGSHPSDLQAAAIAYYGLSSATRNEALVALISSLPESLRMALRFYWDNCSSISLVNDLALLSAASLLPKPFCLGGVGTGILVTHVGALPFLPSVLSTCYYSKDANANLISLGHLHRQGAKYMALPKMILGVYNIDNSLIDHASISANNLPVVSQSLYSSSYALDSTPSASVEVPVSSPKRTFPPS